MYYTDKRHESGGKPMQEDQYTLAEDWRMRDRVKTAFAGLMLCLNVGVDPPDVVKTSPTAILEAWVDPTAPSHQSTKVMEAIGKSLHGQYESLSVRTRYKQFLDPSIEETKRCCVQLRRNAKEERVLFHYNGHGVPQPTPSGEVWYFNRNYTQYIPVSLFDIQQWLAGPSLYVLDVSRAGNIVQNFSRFIEKHEQENQETLIKDPTATVPSYDDNIILAACGKTETLPTNPYLPADLFTACLTTPVRIALRCFILDNPIPIDVTVRDADKVPGRLQERRTPLGELNWIFTAITDTIAWSSLPRDLFRKLFRQDLMVAALFRNYLLAERIMRANGCTPETQPMLPSTRNHPLWESWDLAMEMVLTQLPAIIASEEGRCPYEYQHSSFFAEQLTAFEVYLSLGAPDRKAPDQLPIVLQVLLSQVHRLRALILLSRFLDLGSWAVNLALNIGIFPYVLKLLQSAAHELKPVMIFIWARILAVDSTCQGDLLKDNGYKYFLTVLNPEAGIPVANASEHRAMSAFIIAMFCRHYRQGQAVSLSPELIQACLDHLQDPDNPLLRQWSCLCISVLWHDYPEAKWAGIRALAHERLCHMATDPVPEVRAAALHALTNFLFIPDLTEQAEQIEQAIASTVMTMASDGNSMVRNELLVFFSAFVVRNRNKFLVAAFEGLTAERSRMRAEGRRKEPGTGQRPNGRPEETPVPTTGQISTHSIHATMWKRILILTVDPHPDVAQNAIIITDYLYTRLLNTGLGMTVHNVMDDLLQLSKRLAMSQRPSATPLPRLPNMPLRLSPPSPPKSGGYLSMGIKRTASVAAALRQLALGPSLSSGPLPAAATPVRTSNSVHPRQTSAGLRARVPAEWSRPPDANDHTKQSATYQQAKIPLPRKFRASDPNQTHTLPLQSSFFDWSIEYFREPQMKPNEPDEPGSDDYNSRLWRRSRNEKIINATQPLKGLAGTSRWDLAPASFSNGSQPLKMCFHQFEDHLVVADDRDSIW